MSTQAKPYTTQIIELTERSSYVDGDPHEVLDYYCNQGRPGQLIFHLGVGGTVCRIQLKETLRKK